MNIREALRLKKEFGFVKTSVPTEVSGAEELYHYFVCKIGDLQFMLSNDGPNEDVWFMTFFDYSVKFYNLDSCASVLLAVKQGEWDAS